MRGLGRELLMVLGGNRTAETKGAVFGGDDDGGVCEFIPAAKGLARGAKGKGAGYERRGGREPSSSGES